MFSKTQTEAYKNIKSPYYLREKVLNKCKNTSTAVNFPQKLRVLSLAAACFIAVSAVLFGITHRQSPLEIFLNGMPFEDYTEIGSGMARSVFAANSALSLNFEINSENSTDISVSDGNIQIYNPETYELSSHGKAYCASESVILIWDIENPDTTKIYEMSVNKCVITLEYNPDTGVWCAERKI